MIALKSLVFACSLGILGIGGCQSCTHTVVTPAPANTKSQPKLDDAQLEFNGRIEAQALAANYAAGLLQDGNEKKAVQGSVGVIETLTLGAATQKQKDEAMAPVMAQLAGQYQKASEGWAKATSEAEALRLRVQALEKQVQDERTAAAAELTKKVQEAYDRAKAEADASIRKMIAAIFFGGGALALLATAGVLYFSATVPQLGPRVAIFTAGLGLTLIASGIAVLELLSHPAVIWWGLGISVTFGACAGVAMWYNHLHAVASGQISASPTPTPIVKTP